MTDSLVNLIQSLNGKAEQLRLQKVEYISIITNLRTQLEHSKKQLENANSQIKNLNDKYNQQILKNAFEKSSEDTTEAKLRITAIIKEIENCIKLLSR